MARISLSLSRLPSLLLTSRFCSLSQNKMSYSLWIYFFINATFFPFFLFPILFNYVPLQKVGKCKIGKEEWQSVLCLFFPHPSDNHVTASLLDSFARSSSNPNFPGYLCVSCWRLPQCWHSSSKFPSWRPPLAPICLSLTSSVPPFSQHASCPSVRPHPLSPAYSSLSNLFSNTKWRGPQMDWGLNYAN